MNANAKKWVRALKSGKFKRTQGALGDNKGFCCLGVACELAVKEGVIKPGKFMEDRKEFRYGKDYYFLPTKVQDWLGLSTKKGKFVSKTKITDLADKNDAGASFKTIAKIIESEPEGLFV